MDSVIRGRLNTTLLAGLVLVLAGCGGGSKMLKQPVAATVNQPIVATSDGQVEATLDWVIVKDGPGTWAKNAWWDEYLLRVTNRSDQPVTLVAIEVVDALETAVPAGHDRKQLVKGSKQTAKRYKEHDLEVKPGAGTGTLIAAGTGTLLVASAAAGASIAAGMASAFSFGTASASAPALLTAAGTVALVATPVFIVGGIVKGAHNSDVNKEIIARRLELPAEIPADGTIEASAFFPISPSPQSVNLVYAIDGEHYVIALDTRGVLDGLHLENPVGE